MTDEQVAYMYECVDRRVGRYGLSRDDVADIRQQVAWEVSSTWGRYDPQRAGWRTYISLRVTCSMLNAIRNLRMQRRGEVEMDAEAESVEAVTEGVLDLIEAIPDAVDREVAIMRYEGCTPLMVQRSLGIDEREYNRAIRRIKCNIKNE